MNGPFLATLKSLSTQSLNDASRYEGTTTTNAKVVSQLSRQYATDAVIAKADESILNFKQGSVAPRDFSKKLWGVMLKCSDVCKEQILRGFLSMALTSLSAVLCDVGAWITVKLR